MKHSFSVIMPTYNQCSFIRRAIISFLKQTYTHRELIIINDGCTDETEEYIANFLHNENIRYIKNEENMGLGYALNQGLDAAKYDYIAYLPSDDFYFENHLQIMAEMLDADNLFLVYSGMVFDATDTLHNVKETKATGLRKGFCLQLVQTVHKQTTHRWTTRDEFLTEDLFQMFWVKLLNEGDFGRTNCITCNWTSHSQQRHKIIGERYGGGLNKCRAYYHIKAPITLKVSDSKIIDENKLYAKYREVCQPSSEKLKILIVGELAYNPERIYALEQAGHELYGLWAPIPEYSFNTVGPLPFGHVTDIKYDENWKERIMKIKPDIMYCMLNSGCVPFVYDVVRKCPEIPFVWHFKEGPSVCLKRGYWDKLIYLYRYASGRIFLNKAVQEWYSQYLPNDEAPTMIMDGDLPKADYFKDNFSKKLSDGSDEIHTVVAGRLIGLSKEGFEVLVGNKIHVHLYLENYFDSNGRIIESFRNKHPNYFHYHPHVAAELWTEEFSKFDAGWLHCCNSFNFGNLTIATWDDLNMPARMNTYAAAGIPFIIPANNNSIVASRDFATELGVAIAFESYEVLAKKLRQEVKTRKCAHNMMLHRMKFSFDYYVPQLIKLFRLSITNFIR